MPLWRTWLARCSEEAEVGVRFPGEAPDFTRVCTVTTCDPVSFSNQTGVYLMSVAVLLS